MNKEEILKILVNLSQNDLNDVLLCLLDKDILSIGRLLGLYEQKLKHRERTLENEITQAEGHIFEMMYPCLYETKSLSDNSKDIIARALSFVDKQGLHRTETLHTKLEE